MIQVSKRQEKYDKLMSEAKYFKVDKVMHVIANELSWRMVMRIVNKLYRIKNTGGLTDAEKGLKGCRKRKVAKSNVQLSLFDTTKEKNND